MPTISSFYGIFIRMYLRDHAPPHFHAIYQEHEANVAIETGEVIEGRLPHIAARLVQEWTLAHRQELLIIGIVHGRASHWSGLQDSIVIKVTDIERLGGHRLRIRFSDGSFGEHDFSAMASEPGRMLQPLRDEGYFARVFLDYGALSWPNGFDIAPEWLQRQMEAAGELGRDAA